MKRIVLVSLLAIPAVMPGRAQQLSVTVGYGFYSMKELKQVNEKSGRPAGVPLKNVDNFPAYFTFGSRVSFKISSEFQLGAEMDLASTGSRMAYRDYSGEVLLDQKIWGISIACLPILPMMEKEKNSIFFEPKIGVCFSYLDINSTTVIGEQRAEDKVQFTSMNFFATPSLRYMRWLGSRVGVGVRAGYNITILKGKLYVKGDKDRYLLAEDDAARADWSGLRGDLMLACRLSNSYRSQ